MQEGGFTPLECSAKLGNLDLTNALIEKGANVNHAALNGLSPFIASASSKNSPIARRLLQAGADPVVALVTCSKNNWRSGKFLSDNKETLNLLHFVVKSLDKTSLSAEDKPYLYKYIKPTDIALQAIKIGAIQAFTQVVQDCSGRYELLLAVTRRNLFWEHLKDLIPAIIQTPAASATSRRPDELRAQIEARNQFLNRITPFLVESCLADISKSQSFESFELITALLTQSISDYETLKGLTGRGKQESLALTQVLKTAISRFSEQIASRETTKLTTYLTSFSKALTEFSRRIEASKTNEDKSICFREILSLYVKLKEASNSLKAENLGLKVTRELRDLSLAAPPKKRLLTFLSHTPTFSEQEAEILERNQLALISLSTPSQKQDLLQMGIELLQRALDRSPPSLSVLKTQISSFLMTFKFPDPLNPSLEVDWTSSEKQKEFKAQIQTYLSTSNPKYNADKKIMLDHLFQFLIQISEALLEKSLPHAEIVHPHHPISALIATEDSIALTKTGAGAGAGSGDTSTSTSSDGIYLGIGVPAGSHESWFTPGSIAGSLACLPPSTAMEPSAPPVSRDNSMTARAFVCPPPASSVAYPAPYIPTNSSMVFMTAAFARRDQEKSAELLHEINQVLENFTDLLPEQVQNAMTPFLGEDPTVSLDEGLSPRSHAFDRMTSLSDQIMTVLSAEKFTVLSETQRHNVLKISLACFAGNSAETRLKPMAY